MSSQHHEDAVDLDVRPNDRGAVFLEYGLLASLVAVVAAVGAELLGIAVSDLIQPAIDFF